MPIFSKSQNFVYKIIYFTRQTDKTRLLRSNNYKCTVYYVICIIK